MTTNMEMAVLWDVAPHILVRIGQRFSAKFAASIVRTLSLIVLLM